jgi:hypothetical protein
MSVISPSRRSRCCRCSNSFDAFFANSNNRLTSIGCQPGKRNSQIFVHVLESEATLAVAALGLDPGLGFLRVDTKALDSLAFDVLEPIRPQVDAFVLNWITGSPLKRE